METESQNKPAASHKTRNIILIIVTVLALMGTAVTILFIIDYSRLNDILTADNKDLSDQIDTKMDEIENSDDYNSDLEAEISNLKAQKDGLTADLKTSITAYEDLIDSYDELQESLVELLGEAECEDNYLDLDISYESNGSVSRALRSWAEAHEGEVTNFDYVTFWSGSKDSIHYIVIEDSYLNIFLVFYENEKYDIVNAVYFLDAECWLDGPWREFTPGESAKADLPTNSWVGLSPIQQEPFYTAVLTDLKQDFLGL